MADGLNKGIAFMINMSGRSWWQAEYKNGKVINEWDTVQGGPKLALPTNVPGRMSRWEDLDKKDLVILRILCPGGKFKVLIGALASPRDYLFFQLKTGGFTVGVGQYTEAHIIGVVDAEKADKGVCMMYAWDIVRKQLIGPFKDNIYHMAFNKIGPISLPVQGLRV